jgi:cell division protein FtsL
MNLLEYTKLLLSLIVPVSALITVTGAYFTYKMKLYIKEENEKRTAECVKRNEQSRSELDNKTNKAHERIDTLDDKTQKSINKFIGILTQQEIESGELRTYVECELRHLTGDPHPILKKSSKKGNKNG